jgi:hypothetical protein
MEDCFFWGVPYIETGGFKVSHWPLHSIRDPGFIHITGTVSPNNINMNLFQCTGDFSIGWCVVKE